MNIQEHAEKSLPPAAQFAFHDDDYYIRLQNLKAFYAKNKIPAPYFIAHEGINNDTTSIAGEELINFASYNYLGLSGNHLVSAFSKDAIDRYGTSVSASRIVSGEIPLHCRLEQSLAKFIGAEDCILYVGGHATNVSTIGHLFGQQDLILHDAQIHNSAIEGCRLSGATHMSFRHNNCENLDRLLAKHRGQYKRALILLEGVYSMDGDIPCLPEFIALKKRYNALLMVDEAHSIGVLGKTGRGIGEHFGVNPADIDIWMGTLSKSLASCGGYIAGSRDLVDYLRYTSPGFVFSVGMPPANAAAALAALAIITEHPEYVSALRERSRFFLACANECHLNTGDSRDTPIIPVIIGNSLMTMKVAQALFHDRVLAPPIIFPVVKERAARLRFFVSASHSEEQIRQTVEKTASILRCL